MRTFLRALPSSAFSLHRSFSCALSATLTLRASVKHDDPSTWPKHWNASDIKNLLDSHARPNTAINYESLATLHRLGDVDSLSYLIKSFVKSAEGVELDEYLETHLGCVPRSVPSQEYAKQMDALERALSGQPGSEKRNVAFCYSPHGTDKTQFLANFVRQRRAEAMSCGRVIVRCCDKEAREGITGGSWFERVMQDKATSVATHSAKVGVSDEGLCALVRTHVESVTGNPQDKSKYSDPQAAYKMWISESARFFDISRDKEDVEPLIILDSCQVLGKHNHKFLVHRSSGKPYTLLEAFCLTIPSPYGIFVIGSSEGAIDTTDPVLLTMANVTNIGSLSLKHINKARSSFKGKGK